MSMGTTPIRISLVDSGTMRLNFLQCVLAVIRKEKSGAQRITLLMAEDIAEIIVFCATRPPHVDIHEMKIYPTAQTAMYMVSCGEK